MIQDSSGLILKVLISAMLSQEGFLERKEARTMISRSLKTTAAWNLVHSDVEPRFYQETYEPRNPSENFRNPLFLPENSGSQDRYRKFENPLILPENLEKSGSQQSYYNKLFFLYGTLLWVIYGLQVCSTSY